MITLHYSPGSANFAPHVLLHEIGLPFELALVDRANAAHKSAAYLKLNPNGLIPVLVDGDLVLYEAAAICLHLADSHPQAQLSPPLASLERAHFYKWLVWLTNTVQAHLIHYFYSERLVDPGNHQAAAQVKRHAQAKVAACLQQIDQHLGQTGGPWMMGGRYSALDAYTWMLCRWTRNFDPKPAREHPNIAPFMHRMAQRPALQRAVAAEGLALPLF
jgi:glutathione S-transferase